MNSRVKLHSAVIAGAAGALALVVLLGSPVSSASAAPPVVSTAPYPGEVVVVDEGSPASIPLAGSGEPGESIDVSAVVDGDGYPLCSTTVEADGTWSCLVTEAPDFRGPVTFTNGVEVRELDFGLIHAPRITTDAGDPGSITSTQTFDDPTQLLGGSGVPGAIVTVELNDGGGCSTTVDPAGLWSCALTALPTGAGPYTLTVGQSYADAPSQRAFADPVAFLVGGTTIVTPGLPTPPEPPTPAVPVPPAPAVPAVPAPAVPAPAGPGAPSVDPGGLPASGSGSGSGGGDASLPGWGGDGGGSDSYSDEASARRGGLGDSNTAGGAPSGSGDSGVTAGGVPAMGVAGASTPQNGVGHSGARFKLLGGADRTDSRFDLFRIGGSGSGASGVGVVGRGAHGPGADATSGAGLKVDGRWTGNGVGSEAAGGAGRTDDASHEGEGLGGRDASGGAARSDDATVVADGVPAVPALVERAGELSGFGLSLASIDDVLGRGPASAVFLGALIAGVLLLVILPGGLLEATVHDNLPRIRRSRPIQALEGRVRRPRHGRPSFSRPVRSALGIGTVVAVGALASVVVSPEAGFDPVTGRLFLAFLLASVVVNGVTLSVSAGFARHGLRVRAVPSARPTVLVLTAVSVMVSRVVGLEPGFVFGAVIALQLGATLSARRSARLVVVSTSTLLALGLAAWAVQNALRAGAVEHPDVFSALLLDTATAVTVCALSGPIVSLLPMRFLDGPALFRRSKTAWALLYAVSAAAFGFVLLPLPDAWSAIGGDQLLWFVAFGAFAVLSVGVWAWFRFVPERTTATSSTDRRLVATGPESAAR